MNKIAVLTSGGDSPGMNAAIRAVVRCGLDKGMEVYGIEKGFEGLLDGNFKQMNRYSVGDILQRGGTVLKSARSERFMEPKWVDHGAEMLRTFGIDGLVVIGGNGSLAGGAELSDRGIKVMGVPGTIDNDLGYTDYTIGFDTAVSTVIDAISKVRDTSSAHNRTTIIEVMGRKCGDIALYAGLAGGAEYVVLPEKPFDINEVARKVIEGANKGKLHSIIIKTEGSPMTADEMAAYLGERTGKDTRVVVLSYLQRGGSPTMQDRILATLCGSKAVELLAEDSDSKAIGTVNNQIVAYDLKEALKQKNYFNEEMYRLIDVLSK
ncbi:MAG: 6-phosphofructokinase [Firmicutes bacterium]|nr:6-phosphofructokinase [Bacillota bacterium]